MGWSRAGRPGGLVFDSDLHETGVYRIVVETRQHSGPGTFRLRIELRGREGGERPGPRSKIIPQPGGSKIAAECEPAQFSHSGLLSLLCSNC